MSCLSSGKDELPLDLPVPDDTTYLQSLIDSPVSSVLIPKGERPWYTRPLFLTASNKHIEFESGCKVVAYPGEYQDPGDTLLTLLSCNNVRISGYGASLSMRRSEYAHTPYKKGEWRNGISIYESSDITIQGLEISETGGDGIYIGQRRGKTVCENIVLEDLTLLKNYRQGVSVISVRGFLMEGCVITDTKGTPPSAGIDFEPNSFTYGFSDCVLRNCRFENNAGPGILVYPVKLEGRASPLEIRVENSISKKNLFSVSVYGISDDTYGSINFIDCDLSLRKWIKAGKSAPVLFTKTKDGTK